MITTIERNLVPRLPALTGLRGMAAVWVVLYHTFLGRGLPVISAGYAGVDLFFALSGFVLSHVYFDNTRLASRTGYATFLCVRLARIYPLHLFALLCLFGVVVALPQFAQGYADPENRFGGGAFVASLLLVQNWGGWLPGCWNAPAWSLSAEWLAYLVFPLLLTIIRPVRSPALLVIGAAGAILGTIISLRVAGYTDTGGAGRAGLARMAGEFTAGCLVYAAFRHGWRLPALPGQCLAASLLVVGTLVEQAEFVLLIAFPVLIVLAAQEDNLVSSVLRRNTAVFLGEISFSVYLTHWIVLQVFNWASRRSGDGGAYLIEASLLLFMLLLAIATHRWIERPARLLGRRLIGRSPRRDRQPRPA